MTKPIVDPATTIAATTAMASAMTRFPAERRVAAVAGRQHPAPRRRTSRQGPRRLPATPTSLARNAMAPPRAVSAIVSMEHLGARLGLSPTATMDLVRAQGVLTVRRGDRHYALAESVRRTLNLETTEGGSVGDAAAADSNAAACDAALSSSADRTPTTTTTTKKGSQ